MKIKSGLFSCRRGFTLAELLTVIAIIAILIGLLVPTITIIQKTAQKVKQKSQLHGIEIAMESFRTDFGDYPDSSYTPGVDPGYCGAQKLAEAIVGYDGFGVHPKTEWRSDGMAEYNPVPPPAAPTYELIYDVIDGVRENNTGPLLETPQDNHKVRYGPYLELDSANAVKLGDLYPGAVGNLNLDTYVLADMFGKVTHRRTHKKTGMPIMYYKANVSGTAHTPVPPGDRNVYKVHLTPATAEPIFTTMPPFGNTSHPIDDLGGINIFYDRTANPNFPGPPRRPYRSESYILQSAGRDGLYGTADDVYNFDSEQ